MSITEREPRTLVAAQTAVKGSWDSLDPAFTVHCCQGASQHLAAARAARGGAIARVTSCFPLTTSQASYRCTLAPQRRTPKVKRPRQWCCFTLAHDCNWRYQPQVSSLSTSCWWGNVRGRGLYQRLSRRSLVSHFCCAPCRRCAGCGERAFHCADARTYAPPSIRAQDGRPRCCRRPRLP